MMPLGNKNTCTGIVEIVIGFPWIKFTNCKKVLLDVISMAYIIAATSENPDPFCWNESLIKRFFSPVHGNITPHLIRPRHIGPILPPRMVNSGESFQSFSDFVGKTPPARFSLSFVYKWESPTQESAGRAWRHAKSSNFCQIAKPTASAVVIYVYKRDRLSRRQQK